MYLCFFFLGKTYQCRPKWKMSRSKISGSTTTKYQGDYFADNDWTFRQCQQAFRVTLTVYYWHVYAIILHC